MSILMVNRLLVHYIPTIRGYYTYEGDHMTNIGQVMDIVITGHITPENFYPIVHTLIGMSAIVSDGNIVLYGNISTPLISCFFVISLFLLARLISSDPRVAPLVAAFTAPVMFNRYDIFLMPFGWAIFMTPFALYVLFRQRGKLRDMIVVVPMLVLFPFLHPLACLYLVAVLAITGGVVLLRSRFSHGADGPRLGTISIGHALVLAAIVLPWILSFHQFYPNLRLLYDALATGTSPNVIDDMSATIGKIDLNSFGILTILVKTMGDDLIFLVPSTAISLKILAHRKRITDARLLAFSLMLMLTGSAYATYLFNLVPGLGFVASQRLLFFVAVFTPILGVLWIMEERRESRLRFNTRVVVSAVFVIFASTISILSLFPSPFVVYHNNQVTNMDVQGYDWIFENGDHSIPITSVLSSPERYADLVFGTLASDEIDETEPPPDHFGYNSSNTTQSWPQQTTYLVLLEVSRSTYSGVWSTIGRFSVSDFERISYDTDFSKVFSNGECEIWMASPE